MKRSTLSGALAAAAMLSLAACGGSGTTNAAQPKTSPSAPLMSASTSAGAGLHVASTPLGRVLVNGSGMTVYLLTSDKPNMSLCAGQCLTYWPLVPASEGGSHASGVTGTLGTTTSTSRVGMVTVGGWPLYTFVKDQKPGDVTGEGVKSFGGTWWAVSAAGKAVMSGSAPSGGASTSGSAATPSGASASDSGGY